MSESVTKKISKKSPWRKRQKENQSQKKITFAIYALGILAILILLSRIIVFISSLNSPYSPGGEERVGRWKETSPLTLVIYDTKVRLFRFDLNTQSATIINLPDELYLNMPKGFGRWRVGSIYDLGQSESPPIGPDLLGKTLTYSLGLPIDGYLLLEGENLNFNKRVFEVKNNPLAALLYLRLSKTNLTPQELLTLSLNLKNIRSDKFEEVELNDTQIVTEITLPDKSKGLEVNPDNLNRFIQKNFEDSKLVDEGLSIGIFNATKYPLLAERAERLVESLGGRVIFTQNAKQSLEKTVVSGRESYTKERISNIFEAGCETYVKTLFGEKKEDKNCQEDPDLGSSRADINLYLGEDYYLEFASAEE